MVALMDSIEWNEGMLMHTRTCNGYLGYLFEKKAL
jgi:hypothetical protein